jgi:Ribbon-helix-helix protein, copG family
MYNLYIIRSQANIMSAASLQRTQIYLSSSQQSALSTLARARRSTQSALIRDAIDQFIAKEDGQQMAAARLLAAGAWSAPDSATPSLEELRREERHFA